MNQRRAIVPLTGTQLLRRGRTYREKYEVERALRLAQTATRSLGRFDAVRGDLREPKVKRRPKLAADDAAPRLAARVLKRQHEALAVDAAARQELAADAGHARAKKGKDKGKDKGKGTTRPAKKARHE